MCEKCPQPKLIQPDDQAAKQLARDLIARCHELLPSDTPPERQRSGILVYTHTYTRNALLSHTGGVPGTDVLFAMAHAAATEIRAQAELQLTQAGLPKGLLPVIIGAITTTYADMLANQVSNALRLEGSLNYRPAGPSKEAS